MVCFYSSLQCKVTKGSLVVTTLISIIRHFDDGEIGEGSTRRKEHYFNRKRGSIEKGISVRACPREVQIKDCGFIPGA